VSVNWFIGLIGISMSDLSQQKQSLNIDGSIAFLLRTASKLVH
jgi:hypothetical protein